MCSARDANLEPIPRVAIAGIPVPSVAFAFLATEAAHDFDPEDQIELTDAGYGLALGLIHEEEPCSPE